jgi:hypothetical protein
MQPACWTDSKDAIGNGLFVPSDFLPPCRTKPMLLAVIEYVIRSQFDRTLVDEGSLCASL